jgi:signal peptide peptidase SppA
MRLVRRLRDLFRKKPTVAVIRLYGTIGPSSRFGRSLNDAGLADAVERAFARKPAAVALAINSPGGSAAQSAMIAARIRRLADEKKVPVYAFCEDAAASGGYWLACAADEIYADANAVVGSIGVIYAGFGFHELIARHGVERRVHTAGESKAILDPFRPEKDEDVARLAELQTAIHDNFKAHVRARRGDKLTEGARFDGTIWTGAQAQEVGLVDGIGHLAAVMRGKLGEEVRFREHGRRRGLLERLGAPSAAGLAGAAMDAANERTLWARLGI